MRRLTPRRAALPTPPARQQVRLRKQHAVIGSLYRSWAAQRSRTRFRLDGQEVSPLATALSDAASIEMVALDRKLSARQEAMLSAGHGAFVSIKAPAGPRLGDARQRGSLRRGEREFAA